LDEREEFDLTTLGGKRGGCAGTINVISSKAVDQEQEMI
jgi:hypothetical protein